MSDYWRQVDRRRKAYGHEPYGSAEAHVLAQMMDFDHVIEVLPAADPNPLGVNTVIDRPDLYAPTLVDGAIESETYLLSKGISWTLMNGYSGQDRYAGPIMHESEYIGGQMARDILDTPGVYVAVVAYYTPDDYPLEPDGGDELEHEVDGWAVARLDERDTP